MHTPGNGNHRATVWFSASAILGVISISLAFAAVKFTLNYGILSALVAGTSVGSGILFSNGLQNIANQLVKEKLIGLGLFMVATTILVIMTVPGTQYKYNGEYYLNITGLLIETLFEFSTVAFLYTALLLAAMRKSRTNADMNL